MVCLSYFVTYLSCTKQVRRTNEWLTAVVLESSFETSARVSWDTAF